VLGDAVGGGNVEPGGGREGGREEEWVSVRLETVLSRGGREERRKGGREEGREGGYLLGCHKGPGDAA